jgi:nucleoside-diphosphate-sugar epimerase
MISELDRLLDAAPALWDGYRGARVFLTGGTGFFGGWLLESLLWAADRRSLGVAVTVLTRDPEGFRSARPHLASHPAVTLLRGDVLTLEPFDAQFTHVLHAATASSAKVGLESPRLRFETIIEGTRRVLEVARRSGARRFLLTSSGAVYGRQPPELTHVPEEYVGAPDLLAPGAAYGEGKRAAELLCRLAAEEHGFDAIIARCFAFAGPYLPLDAHYAIGNFVRDALAGGPIRVGGDGTPFRSYLYGADLAAWLWTLLARGDASRPYNVGSERAVSIADLAATVARVLGVERGVEIAGVPVAGRAAERYVPSTRRAREELGLAETFTLEESIRRMADYGALAGGPAEPSAGARTR